MVPKKLQPQTGILPRCNLLLRWAGAFAAGAYALEADARGESVDPCERCISARVVLRGAVRDEQRRARLGDESDGVRG